MLPLKLIQENSAFIIERLKIKNFDATPIIGRILATDERRRSLQTSIDIQLADLNNLAKQIGQLFKEGKSP